jgi:hypothetical protein
MLLGKEHTGDAYAGGAASRCRPDAGRSALIGALKNGSCVVIPDTCGNGSLNAIVACVPLAAWIAWLSSAESGGSVEHRASRL